MDRWPNKFYKCWLKFQRIWDLAAYLIFFSTYTIFVTNIRHMCMAEYLIFVIFLHTYYICDKYKHGRIIFSSFSQRGDCRRETDFPTEGTFAGILYALMYHVGVVVSTIINRSNCSDGFNYQPFKLFRWVNNCS